MVDRKEIPTRVTIIDTTVAKLGRDLFPGELAGIHELVDKYGAPDIQGYLIQLIAEAQKVELPLSEYLDEQVGSPVHEAILANIVVDEMGIEAADADDKEGRYIFSSKRVQDDYFGNDQ